VKNATNTATNAVSNAANTATNAMKDEKK
jgi:hypothetical protein